MRFSISSEHMSNGKVGFFCLFYRNNMSLIPEFQSGIVFGIVQQRGGQPRTFQATLAYVIREVGS